jgi:ElaB/YqjD/DUF883 family membrane-anchored ribosome-binding protein
MQQWGDAASRKAEELRSNANNLITTKHDKNSKKSIPG